MDIIFIVIFGTFPARTYGTVVKAFSWTVLLTGIQGLVLGAYCISPVESLYIEADQLPLTLRPEKLALKYSTKLKSCLFNPAYDCTYNPKYKQHFERKEKSIKTFGLRMKSTLQE